MAKDKTNDMTVGNPVSLIIRFMIPMCLGNIFQQFYNIADSIVAGQFLGVDALAAIGSTGSLMFFVTGWLNGLSSGFAILVSQWFGAKQYDKMRHYVAMSIYLAAAFAIVMTIGFEALNEPILRLMNSPEDLMGSVKGYMGIIYAGLIVTAAYNSLAAFLRALGDSKSPLYFLIISAVINVFLDILFIVKIGMGVEGCAYATVIAQAISAVCCLIYIIKKFPILHLKKENFEVSFTSFRYLLALGIPMGLQFSITAIGTIIVQGAVNITVLYIWQDFPLRENTEYHCNCICSFWCDDGNLCRTEPGRRKDGPCKSRNEIYPDHDPDLECDHYDHYVLFRKVHDLVIY